MPALPRSFYARPAIEVARALLGKIVVHRPASDDTHQHERAGRIVETEAYLGTDDPAAHAFRGVTPRTRLLFGPPGHAYVYLIYGMYYCLNAVADSEGSAGCVLIRAIEPIAPLEESGSGPGRLTRALGITLKQNGADLTRESHGTHGSLTIREPGLETGKARFFETAVSPRIGVRQAADWPLRFYIRGNPHVRRSPRKIG
jgi:DNA-3-methyladenine glycosylase